jgi:hypothetical protein
MILANIKELRRVQKQDSAYIKVVTKLGLYLGNKPAQRTLWYWTYIPIGVFITSWLAFFINGGLEKQTPMVEDAQVKSTVTPPAYLPKPDTVVMPVIAPVTAKPMDIALAQERLKLEKDRLKLEQERLKLAHEVKQMTSKRLEEERRQQEPQKQESVNAIPPADQTLLPSSYKPIPGVPDSILKKR